MKTFYSWQELADYIIESERNNEILRLKAEIDKLHHDNDVLQYVCERRVKTIKGYEEFTDRLIHELRKANKGSRRLRAKLNAAEKQLGKLRCRNCSFFVDHPYKEGMGICLNYEGEQRCDAIPCYKFKK